MLFICQKEYLNYITFHIPKTVSIQMKRDQWISRLDTRILADGISTSFIGEYIDGDLFIDITPDRSKDLLRVMSSRDVSIEFGPGNDRPNLHQSDFAPNNTANLKGFLRDYVPMALKTMGGKNIRLFDQVSMFTACRQYKLHHQIFDLSYNAV
jgi:hypothetical protein